MFEKKIPPARLDRYLEDPRLKARLFILNIITFAFFSAPVVYAVLVATDIGGEEGVSDLGFPIWWILAAISIMQIPALFIIGFLMLNQAENESGFIPAFEKGKVALIIALAFGESVCVFGVVASILGAPDLISYAFLGFGVILMGVSLIVFRPKLVAIAVKKLIEEEKGEP
ncbi:MAG: hypothetical protein H6751_02085 [Candidatus Omnitrophica bacterium]|nr:hypothetical protein [Candidatus Omnitrophota bacterium]